MAPVPLNVWSLYVVLQLRGYPVTIQSSDFAISASVGVAAFRLESFRFVSDLETATSCPICIR